MLPFRMKAFLMLSMTVSSSLAWALPVSCLHIYNSQTQEAPAISTNLLVSQLHRNDAIRAFANLKENKIGWQSFEDIKKLKKEIQFYLQYYNRLSSEQKLEERRNLLNLIQNDPQLKSFFAALENPGRIDYSPTQYEMRKKLLSEIIGVLKILPEELRPKISKVAYDERRRYINRQAEELMAEAVKSFDELLAKDNYSYAQLEKTIRESTDPYIQKALKLVEEGLDAGTYVRESGRFWTPKLGFQNVFVAKTSAGGDLGKQNKRHRVEASGMGLEIQKYYQLDDEVKPKYGSLDVNHKQDVTPNLQFSGYGQDYYAFKHSDIDKRLSVFFGDSYGIPSYLENGLGESGPASKAMNWRGRFIPWDRKLMLVPFIAARFKEINSFSLSSVTDPVFSDLPHGKVGSSTAIEIQIFGQLDLDNVESFSFRGKPPTGEFLNELKKRNITIYDQRDGIRKLWNEGEK